MDPGGLAHATFLPIVWDEDRVVAHLARANPQHGKVVPTWTYSAVHLRGDARVFHDPDGLRRAVSLLTDLHEEGRPEPWAVSDAPAPFVEATLRGIVGLEITVRSVEAKAKLNQNRPVADRLGVIDGLRMESGARGEHQVAAAMERLLPTQE